MPVFLGYLDLKSTGFEVKTEITKSAILLDLRVAEMPSMELPRRSGASNLHTFKDGLRVLRTLFRELSIWKREQQIDPKDLKRHDRLPGSGGQGRAA
jgi:hypothetical protein